LVVADPVTHLLQELQQTQLVQEVANGVSQLHQLQSQLQQLEQTYTALTHVNNISSLVPALSQLGVNNPLPTDAMVIESALRGGGSAGFTGIMNGLFNATQEANTIFVPNDGSIASQQLQARINATSTASAMGDSLYQAAGQRQSLIQQLTNSLNASTDIKTSTDILGRLMGEENIATDLNTQATAALIQTQQAKDQQSLRTQQQILQADQNEIRAGCAQTGWC